MAATRERRVFEERVEDYRDTVFRVFFLVVSYNAVHDNQQWIVVPQICVATSPKGIVQVEMRISTEATLVNLTRVRRFH